MDQDNIGAMHQLEVSELLADASGSTEDVSRDVSTAPLAHAGAEHGCTMTGIEDGKRKRKGFKKKLQDGRGHTLTMWTINAGGLSGTWRVAHHIASLSEAEKPQIVCIQETSCNESQWMSLQKFMSAKGFRGFHTGGRQLGERHQSMQFQWHRGIVTFVDDAIASNVLGEHSWRGGQFHAVMVDRIMLVNYYVAPRDEFIMQQTCKCQDLMEEIQWKGRWIMMGDFNETFEASWIATLATIYGGWRPECDFGTTRWNGERVIDYAIANFDLPCLQTKEEKLSDHLVVCCTFDYSYQKDAPQWRFQNDGSYSKPLWLSKAKWQKLFDDAFCEGQNEEWSTCCRMVEEIEDWEQAAEVNDQVAVDYEWCLCCAQLTWSFVNACRMALLDIPEHYANEREMRRVLHAANHVKIKGYKIKLQERTMPRSPLKRDQVQRRRLVRIGRLNELKIKLEMGKRDVAADNLAKKLYDVEVNEVSLAQVKEEMRQLEQSQEQEEANNKFAAINDWKKQMCTNITAKSSWINKKGSKLSPSIDDGTKVTETKMQAAKVLHGYWGQLWAEQRWTDEEKPGKVQKIVEQLRGDIAGLHIPKGRPTLQCFRKQLGSIKGCAGIDGWSSEELSVVAMSDAASRTIWNAMSRWETFAAIPSPLKHCKLVHVPKKQLRVLKPGQFRPIAIMSAFWRTWSSTWMRSKWIQKWTTLLFPAHITGGLVGAQGPEVMAAIIAHELNIKKHGLTMDFRHAFDTVDVEVMEQVFQSILPKSCRRWHTLLFEQWKTMDRWISFDAGIFPQSHKVQQGLPQGDPGSCVVMATLMLSLMKMVDAEVKEDGESVYQAIYMDDRTVVAKSKDTLLQVQRKWHQLADEFHLLENPEKAQFVNMAKKDSAFEVLGTIVGNFQEQKQKDSRLVTRVSTIGTLYKKIGILPGGFSMKMRDVGIFARPRLAYGWVSAKPKRDWIQRQEQLLWKSWAKLTYANAHMRRLMTGAHTSLRMIAFLRQLRLLSQRNSKLQEFGNEVTQCQLDNFVYSTLTELNWRFENGKFVRDLFAEGYQIQDLVQDCQWRRVGHYVRESYRQLHYQLFTQCGRHELSGHVLPPYDSQRRKLACQWAGQDGLAWLLIQGAVQSPNVRLTSSGIHSRCHICGEPQPVWEHLWQCFTGEVAPSDFLLRRHLWPRDMKDFTLCTSFLMGLRKFNEQ